MKMPVKRLPKGIAEPITMLPMPLYEVNRRGERLEKTNPSTMHPMYAIRQSPKHEVLPFAWTPTNTAMPVIAIRGNRLVKYARMTVIIENEVKPEVMIV